MGWKGKGGHMDDKEKEEMERGGGNGEERGRRRGEKKDEKKG